MLIRSTGLILYIRQLNYIDAAAAADDDAQTHTYNIEQTIGIDQTSGYYNVTHHVKSRNLSPKIKICFILS